MKRLKRLLPAVLALMLALPATPYASAEDIQAAWRADLTALLSEEEKTQFLHLLEKVYEAVK